MKDLIKIPQIGDFIITKVLSNNAEFNNFINSTIGKVEDVYTEYNNLKKKIDYLVLVKYNKIPVNIKNYFNLGTSVEFKSDDIVVFSNDIEIIEEYLKNKLENETC